MPVGRLGVAGALGLVSADSGAFPGVVGCPSRLCLGALLGLCVGVLV